MQGETEESMAERVRQLIEQVYCRKYAGLLRVRHLVNYDNSHRGWLLTLGLHVDERPLEIAYDGTSEEFLDRLHKRLHEDHLHHTDYFNGYKITLDPNQDPSTAIPPKDIKASII